MSGARGGRAAKADARRPETSPPRVGTAGWTIPKTCTAAFAGDGPHLVRYARTMRCVEINSSFYRPHRPTTWRRWADETPDDFRFAVKLPRTITHEAKLVDAQPRVDAFFDEIAGLGAKLGVVLVQLPPSLAFDAARDAAFFAGLRARHPGAIVCEPRHPTWFADEAHALLRAHRVGRAGADPACAPGAGEPGGWLGPNGDGRGAVLYYRWHGSPRMYWSDYPDAWLAGRAAALARWPSDAERWCIFDNTGGGFAMPNALAFRAMVDDQSPRAPAARAIADAAPR